VKLLCHRPIVRRQHSRPNQMDSRPISVSSSRSCRRCVPTANKYVSNWLQPSPTITPSAQCTDTTSSAKAPAKCSTSPCLNVPFPNGTLLLPRSLPPSSNRADNAQNPLPSTAPPSPKDSTLQMQPVQTVSLTR